MLHLYKAQFYYPFFVEQGTFEKLNKENPEGGEWFKPSNNITLNNPETFAEYVYFHPHARKLLFDREKPALLSYHVNDEKIAEWTVHLDIPHYPNGENPPPTGKAEDFHVCLNLDWVQIMFYDLDVGVLSFGVSWDCEQNSGDSMDFETVLDVNCLLRRSGPSFLNHDSIKNFRKGKRIEKWADEQKSKRELPHTIWFEDANGNKHGFEDFGEKFDELFINPTNNTPYLSVHFDFWKAKALDELGIANSFGGPILDERNFVTAFIITDTTDTGWELASKNKQPDNEEQPQLPSKNKQPDNEEQPHQIYQSLDNPFGMLEYESDAFQTVLYKTLFVDPAHNKYEENPQLRKRLLVDSLYLRYRDMGTYYGFTRYSGIYLFQVKDGKDWYPRNIVSHHYDTMYFQLTNLLLTIRAALLDFSRRSADISAEVDSPDDLAKDPLKSKIENLRGDFLKFSNKYWFTEITAQEQGIEMYDLWTRQMGNEVLFREVEEEIKALHEYGEQVLANRLQELTYLNLSALGLAFIALLVGAFSLSDSFLECLGDTKYWWAFVIVFFLSLIVAYRLFVKGSDVIDFIKMVSKDIFHQDDRK